LPKTASNPLYQTILAILSFLLLSSCGLVPVPGLYVEVDGNLVSVLSEKVDNPTNLHSDGLTGLRYIFSETVALEAASDLAIQIAVTGSVKVAVFAAEEDDTPFMTASFEGLGEPLLEFRLPLPDGTRVTGVELSLGDAQAAVIKGFSISPPYSGYRAGGSDGSPAVVSLGVQRSFAASTGSLPAEVQLPVADVSGWSVVVRQGSAGSLRIRGQSSGFESSPRPDQPLAIPLELLGGSPVSVMALDPDTSTTTAGRPVSVAGARGIIEAQLHFGGDAPLSDLHAILSGTSMDQDYKLYRWDLFPDTLVFDFADYAVQDSYFKRLAFFAEKPGFRGRLADDAEIAALHAWNAHDYPPWTLANFYNLAADTAFRLNTSELALLDILLAYGIVKKEADGRLEPGKGAIISVTRESTAVYRRIFMDHEASHALFFQDEAYRLLSEQLWEAHDPATRRFWIRHLRWRNYDTTDSYLNVNELQAYMVQQSAPGAVTYIRDNVLVRLAAAYPAEAEVLLADTPAILAATATDAAALDAYLREHWDIAAGRFGRTRRLNLP
jgi:hypothetical protein